jgi:CheY-like chemotaxis protein
VDTEIPVIAVTTLASTADKEKGLMHGITEYQVKLDRDMILEACERYVLFEGEKV